MAFSATTRQQNIERLQNETLDLLVIGGGITVPVSPFNQPQ